jgi:hypothetical protein
MYPINQQSYHFAEESSAISDLREQLKNTHPVTHTKTASVIIEPESDEVKKVMQRLLQQEGM